MAANEVLDRTVIAELRALGSEGEDLLGEVVQEFLARAPDDIRAIVSTLESAAGTDAERAAHRLKGSALSVGAPRFAALCAEVERAARDGDLSAARTAAAGLDTALADARDAFAREIG